MRLDSRRTALAWALGVPFFLMPVPLTVDAPDIYGGYAIHAQQFVGMILVGGLLALFDTRGAELLAALRARPALHRLVTAVGWLGAMFLLAGVVGVLAPLSARPLGRLLGAMSVVPARSWPLPEPSLLVAGAVLIPLLRLPFGRGKQVAPVRAIALVALVAQAGVWFLANQFTEGQLPPIALVGLAVLVSAAWPLLRGSGGVGDRVAWGLVIGGLFVPCGVLLIGLVVPWAPRVGDGGARALAVAGGLAGAVMIARWLAPTIATQRAQGVLVAADVTGNLGRRLPLVIALVLFGAVVSGVAVLAAGVLVELFGWLDPTALRRVGAPVLPAPLYLPWLALVVGLGAVARDHGGLRRFLGGVSAAFAALVVGQIADLLGFSWVWTAVFLLLIGWVLALRFVPLPRSAWILATALGPLTISPVIARYMLSIWVGGAVPVWIPLVLGLVVTAAAVALIPREPDEVPIAWRVLVLRLPLVGVALILPIYITVHAGIRPLSFAIVVGALLVALVVTRRLGPRPLPAGVALWLLFYAGFAQTAVFKVGPGADECTRILETTSARVLLDRHGEGGEYADAYPYDAVPLPGGASVLASFKRIDKRGGFLEVLDPRDPSRRARTVVQREGSGGPLWPERIVTDPSTGRALVQIIGVGAHAMWELIPGGTAAQPVTIGRSLDLPYEPGNPSIDAGRRTMAVTYVPNRSGGNPLLEVFDLDTLSTRGEPRGRRVMQMSDYVETDVGSGRHYAPTLYDFLRFAVIEFEPDLSPGRHWETFHPVIGLAADHAAGRLYVTNPLAGVIDVLDLDSFEVVQTVPVGGFPRDVAHDPQRHRLYVANYGDGSVVTFDTAGGELREVARAEVGWLLRGLGVDAESGLVVASSGCGVFAISE